MKIYFDTEFTGLHKDTNLISIGLVDENGKTFYAEFDSYGEVSEWIQLNVVEHLVMNDRRPGYMVMYNNCIMMKDSFIRIREELNRWLRKYDSVQFVSDVSHYDFVLIIDLISGDALSLPDNISAVCRDINQDMARYLNISDKEAFNICREDFAGCKADKKHNALHDAEVIKQIDNIVNC